VDHPEGLAWIIERLEKRHDRAAFSSGVAELDGYLRHFAAQNERTGISQHYVAVATAGDTRILGYYALSVGSVAFDVVPEDLRKRLPRYPIPVAHLGRLAVDGSVQGRGIGEDLLLDALARIARAADEVGIHAVEVVAISSRARDFYVKYGFIALLDDDRHLYLTLKVARQLELI
jgi:GNAT superfamily N-acetyltransferase